MRERSQEAKLGGDPWTERWKGKCVMYIGRRSGSWRNDGRAADFRGGRGGRVRGRWLGGDAGSRDEDGGLTDAATSVDQWLGEWCVR